MSDIPNFAPLKLFTEAAAKLFGHGAVVEIRLSPEAYRAVMAHLPPGTAGIHTSGGYVLIKSYQSSRDTYNEQRLTGKFDGA